MSKKNKHDFNEFEHEFIFSSQERDEIKKEVLDRFDIYDFITITGLDFEDVYDILESVVLDHVEDLELRCIKYED